MAFARARLRPNVGASGVPSSSSTIGFIGIWTGPFTLGACDIGRARLSRAWASVSSLHVDESHAGRTCSVRRHRVGSIVEPLPMAPSCALDEAGLRQQLERYRQIGRGANVRERGARALVLDVDRRVEADLVEGTIATERECCPFFDLRWEPDVRRLTISVSHAEHEPALDAIAFALGLGAPARAD
ncbi:MAG TPA: hypothetical protein VK707_03235 [Solirubrobacteraceae bacterium]|nr:hypothetical protein [Solirubrobacteraceae bacterium]